MKRAGKQTNLRTALEQVSRRLDARSKGGFRQVRAALAWQKVAGPQVTAHTTDAHLRGGELTVHVDDGVWATELSALAGPYRDAMNAEMGENAVTSVRFTVSRRVAKRRTLKRAEERDADHYAPDDLEPVPLTEVERAQVVESASQIADEKLREAVIRATIAGMEWRKGQKAAKSRQGAREGL